MSGSRLNPTHPRSTFCIATTLGHLTEGLVEGVRIAKNELGGAATMREPDPYPPELAQLLGMGDLEPNPPILLELSPSNGPEKLLQLVAEHSVRRVVDNFRSMLTELIYARQPELRKSHEGIAAEIECSLEDQFGTRQVPWWVGNWAYLPWNGTLLRLLAPDLHHELRTTRNQVLYNVDERARFRNLKVAIAGLSVGGTIALTVSLEGGAERMKLADHDVLSGSNLNRLRAGFDDIGAKKAHIIARQIYSLNPYAALDLYPEGLDQSNMEEFVTAEPKPDVIVEEVDDLAVKIELRLLAQKHRVPVVMATNLGRRIVLDVERFDLEPDRAIFHGRLGNEPRERVARSTSLAARVDLMFAIAGRETMPENVLEMEPLILGGQLERPSQLGGTVSACGAVVASLLWDLAGGRQVASGRHVFDLTTPHGQDNPRGI